VEQVAPPVRATGWLKDPPFDLTLIVGITILAIGMGGAAAYEPALFLPLLAFHTWCFGFDHVIATFTKLAGTRSDRRRHRFLIFGLPPIVFGVVLAASFAVGIGGLNTAYFLFQWFHTTRQSWGIAQHYRRAAGGMAWDPPWLSELVLWSVPVVGILRRCADQPSKFLWMELRLPAVPPIFVTITGAVAAVLVGVFVVTRVVALLRGELRWPHALFLGCWSTSGTTCSTSRTCGCTTARARRQARSPTGSCCRGSAVPARPARSATSPGVS
jgi:hypothetical protein